MQLLARRPLEIAVLSVWLGYFALMWIWGFRSSYENFGFVLSVVRCTITGSVTNVLPSAIRMTNDSLHAELLHCEYVTNMVSMSGVGGIHAEAWTGSGNAVTNMIALASTYTGKISARMMIPNGATGNIINFVDPAKTDVAASGGMLANYTN